MNMQSKEHPRRALQNLHNALQGRHYQAPTAFALAIPGFSSTHAEALSHVGYFNRLEHLRVGAGTDAHAVRRVLNAAPRLKMLEIGECSEPELLVHPGLERIRWLGGPLEGLLRMPLLRAGVRLEIPVACRKDRRVLANLLPKVSGLTLRWLTSPRALVPLLAANPDLEQLSLCIDTSDPSVSALFQEDWPNLRDLHIENIGESSVLALGSWPRRMPRLESLTLRNVDAAASWSQAGLGRLRVVDIGPLTDTQALQEAVRQGGEQLHTLRLDLGPSSGDPLRGILEHCPELRHVTLDDAWASAAAIAPLGGCKKMESIQLMRAWPDDEAFWSAVSNLDGLLELRVVASALDESLPSRMPNTLETLDLSNKSTCSLWLSEVIERSASPNLRTLRLMGCDLETMPKLAPLFPALESLDISRARNVEYGLLRGIESSLVELAVERLERPDDAIESGLQEWITGTTWPRLQRLSAPDLLVFDRLQELLGTGRAPSLIDLHCSHEDPETVYQYLGSATSQLLDSLRVGRGLEIQRLRAIKPEGWPRMTASA